MNIRSTPQENNIDLAKLAKVCGKFGSSNENERATAGLRADLIIRRAGLTWADLLTPHSAQDDDPIAAAHWCLQHPKSLSPWERKFLKSVIQKGYATGRQPDKITEIRGKLWGAGHAA